MEATLDFLFRIDRKQEETIPFHKHRCYELVYYAAGRGGTRIGSKEWRFDAGRFAVVRPFTLHDERHDAPTDVLCVGFARPDDAPVLAEGVYDDDPEAPLLPLLERMLAELQAKRPRFARMLDLYSAQLALELERRLPTEGNSEEGDHFLYTLNFMNEHFSQRIDFASLSALAGYSYDRYRHLFKEKTGYSPVQYLMNKRMEHARRLLLHTRLPVSAVALECGFSNDAQFCSVFKREHGLTPRAFRDGGRLTGGP